MFGWRPSSGICGTLEGWHNFFCRYRNFPNATASFLLSAPSPPRFDRYSPIINGAANTAPFSIRNIRVSLLEERQDRLRRLVRDRQSLHAQLLLDL